MNTDFGTWLREKRQKANKTSFDFAPTDSGTIIRVENGKTKIRLQTMLGLLAHLDIGLVQFLDEVVGIEIAESELEQTNRPLSDGGNDLHAEDVYVLVDAYVNGRDNPNNPNNQSIIAKLVGTSAMRIAQQRSEHSHWGNFDYAPDDSEIVGRWILRFDPAFTHTFWEYPYIADDGKTMLRMARQGILATPQDAYDVLADTIARYKEDDPKLSVKIPPKLNAERFRLVDLLEPCQHFSQKDATAMIILFWFAFKSDMALRGRYEDYDRETVEQVEVVGRLFVALWRWLQFYDDQDSLTHFADAVRLLKPSD